MVVKFVEEDRQARMLLPCDLHHWAKRQRNWFRREQWLTPVPGDAPADQLLSIAQEISSQ